MSSVERVSSVGVMDGSSLTGISMGAEVVLLLAASVGLFVLGRIVLAFLFLLALFHQCCKKASWLSFSYVGVGEDSSVTGAV